LRRVINVISNNTQCQITRIRSLVRRCLLFRGLWLWLGLIIPTSSAQISYCELFGNATYLARRRKYTELVVAPIGSDRSSSSVELGGRTSELCATGAGAGAAVRLFADTTPVGRRRLGRLRVRVRQSTYRLAADRRARHVLLLREPVDAGGLLLVALSHAAVGWQAQFDARKTPHRAAPTTFAAAYQENKNQKYS